jgi:acylphosphatase
VCVTAVVRGRVQGVAFRASLAAEGRRPGVAGWVSNARDGSVHFAAVGEGSAVDALLDWARRGPPLARVDSLDVAREIRAAELPAAFSVRADLPV